MSHWTPTDQMIQRAASELASQEKYNPNWVRPDGWHIYRDLYEQRARLILEAAMDGAAFRPEQPDSAPAGQEQPPS